MNMRLPALCGLLMILSNLAGCVSSRVVTIRTDPPDALVSIDGLPPQKGPIITESFVFDTALPHRVTISRAGFRDEVRFITRDQADTELPVKLKPESQMITIFAEPEAIISVDGVPISNGPVSSIPYNLTMGVDPKTDNPIPRVVSATRDRFQPESVTITRANVKLAYTLKLKPLTKPITITSDPPGAEVLLDETAIGTTPIVEKQIEFPVDTRTNEFIPLKLRAEKTGYQPTTEITFTYETVQPSYEIKVPVWTKEVRIKSDPPDAIVIIDGKEIPRNAAGYAVKALEFPPINDKGALPIYTAIISKKTPESDWETQTLEIPWDNGQTDYYRALKEILTRPVEMLYANVRRTDAGWGVAAQWVQETAVRNVAEPLTRPVPQRLTPPVPGQQLGNVVASPDGSKVMFTILTAAKGGEDFRSQIVSVRTDGTGGREIITDAKSLDLMPSFTPSGDEIVFSSNRIGGRMRIYSMSATNSRLGVTERTGGDTNDLWPVVDSEPKPRLFYQSMIDVRNDPRIYVSQPGTSRTDLIEGSQPRVGPKNDVMLFTRINPQTLNRDIYRVNVDGGEPQNLTNTPDADDCDAAWSKDGSKIIFASNRTRDESGRANYDLWMIDLAKPEQPVQVTFNGSRDDSPSFDLFGTNVFFRSNRGGEWGIWKLALPR